MSDHAWVLDHIAPYITNGLDASERDRVEAHTASCERCAHELAEVRALDRAMEALFVPVRPRPGLEDTVIQRLRTARPARVRPAWIRYAVGAAAVVLLGILGAITTSHMTPRAVERAAIAWSAPPPVDSEAVDGKDVHFTLEEPYDLRKQTFHTLEGVAPFCRFRPRSDPSPPSKTPSTTRSRDRHARRGSWERVQATTSCPTA